MVWELATRWAASPLLFPTAVSVLQAFGRSIVNGEVPGYAVQSLKVLLSGMAIGAALALVLATVAVTTRLGADVLETLTAMFNPLPAIALMPLALLWFGLGVKSVIFVVVHSVLWPMALNTYTGFVAVPQTLRRVGLNFGLTGWRLVAGILLPAAFPYLLSGIKIGWVKGYRGAAQTWLGGPLRPIERIKNVNSGGFKSGESRFKVVAGLEKISIAGSRYELPADDDDD